MLLSVFSFCQFGPDGVCLHCDEPKPAQARGAVFRQCQPGKGLGDQVEGILTGIGITQDRYQQAKQLFGLPPTCNCQGRKAWLNKVSRWWRGQKHN